MKRLDFQIIDMEESQEESQVNDIDQIFKKIAEENFFKLRKDIPIQIQNTHATPNRQAHKRKHPWHIITETLRIHDK